MKKFYLLLILSGIILMSGLAANAWSFKFWRHKTVIQEKIKTPQTKDFEILPTMDSESKAKNQVWVGTFQLIWNDLIDELIHQPVEFIVGESITAKNLNKRSFTVDDLDEASYYKKFALASPKIKKEIENGIKQKFNEKSDILDLFDWTPAEGKYILYAMLKKDFEYIETFDKLPEDVFIGSSGKVKYFGVDKDSKGSLRNTVGVLFYNNNDDYAVTLKSKQGDTVFLYRTNDSKTLDKLYQDMISKSEKYNGKKWLTKVDEFKAPVIEFKKEREFPELCNKQIKNSNYMISKAIETVQFKMNESGVKLKSEAGMMMCLTCAPGFRDEPRYFYFNNKYVIFLQEKNKPYFGMKIEDAKSLQ